MTAVYRNPRPLLTVESLGGRQLGRCYHSYSYRVTSTSPLAAPFFAALRASGAVSDGQGFVVLQELPDGKTAPVPAEVKWNSRPEPSGADEVPAIDVDDRTGQPTGKPALAWTGAPIGPTKMSYWTYRIDVAVDSSD